MASSELARVYRVQGETFACWRATGRRFALGDFPAIPSVPEFGLARRVTLAGKYVGFELVGDGRSGASDAVVVRDVSTGRYRHQHLAHEDRSPSWDFTPDRGVSALAVRPDGSIAWIVKSLFGVPLRVEVHKIDHSGHALLDVDDNARDIKPGSLAVNQRAVYWIHGTEARWAPFK